MNRVPGPIRTIKQQASRPLPRWTCVPGFATVFIVWTAAVAASETVVGYRRDGTGVFADAAPVTAFDTTTGSNILWKLVLPDWGHSSPILLGRRLFLNVEPQTLLCIDADTGTLLWKQDSNVFDLFPEESRVRLKAEWQINWQWRRSQRAERERLRRARERLDAAPSDPGAAAEVEKILAEQAAAKARFEESWEVLNKGYFEAGGARFRGACRSGS